MGEPANRWVFGYGSLIWSPGFSFLRRSMAVIEGYHRSFCMHSIHHRGSPDQPGLVLALEPRAGAQCKGVAFEIAEEDWPTVHSYLRARELISSAYLEAEADIRLEGEGNASALVFVVDTEHVQYTGPLPLESQGEIIARAIGGRGPNWEYLYATVEHLGKLGISDPALEELAGLVRSRREVFDRFARD